MKGEISAGKAVASVVVQPHGLPGCLHALKILTRAIESGRCRSERLECLSNLEQALEEGPVDAALQTPSEDVGVEHVPVLLVEHTRPNFCLRLDQTLCGQGLHCLAQRSARYTESFHQLHVAGQRGSGP